MTQAVIKQQGEGCTVAVVGDVYLKTHDRLPFLSTSSRSPPHRKACRQAWRFSPPMQSDFPSLVPPKCPPKPTS